MHLIFEGCCECVIGIGPCQFEFWGPKLRQTCLNCLQQRFFHYLYTTCSDAINKPFQLNKFEKMCQIEPFENPRSCSQDSVDESYWMFLHYLQGWNYLLVYDLFPGLFNLKSQCRGWSQTWSTWTILKLSSTLTWLLVRTRELVVLHTTPSMFQWVFSECLEAKWLGGLNKEHSISIHWQSNSFWHVKRC